MQTTTAPARRPTVAPLGYVINPLTGDLQRTRRTWRTRFERDQDKALAPRRMVVADVKQAIGVALSRKGWAGEHVYAGTVAVPEVRRRRAANKRARAARAINRKASR